MSTTENIIQEETEIFIKNTQKYSSYFNHAIGATNLLATSIQSVHSDRFIFTLFLSHLRKHHFLALLSTTRQHHVQATMNLRQVLEAMVCASYAIAHPVKKTEIIKTEPTNKYLKKAYNWIKTAYPTGSQVIKKQKDIINNSTAHVNPAFAHQTFKYDPENRVFQTPFFDFENEYLIKSDFWFIANMVIGITDLFYKINKDYDGMKFQSNFIAQLKELETENNNIKKEMIKHPRFKASLKKDLKGNIVN